MNKKVLFGRILKGIGGFYYVEVGEDQIIECKARGLFRHSGITPLPGDWAKIEMSDDGRGYIVEVERKNQLIRPPVSNIDLLFIVVALASPRPAPLFIDKLISIAENKRIEPILVFNKSDLSEDTTLPDRYRAAGFTVVVTSAEEGSGLDEIKALLAGKICVFCGNSGVGKSSILNRLDSRLGLKVGEVAEKTQRGKHTTRHVELFHNSGGMIVDTPGFGDISIERFERVRKDELPDTFREFEPYITKCKFTGCSHTKEKGCAVREAVEKGEISLSRHESYCTMYEEVKDIKSWQE